MHSLPLVEQSLGALSMATLFDPGVQLAIRHSHHAFGIKAVPLCLGRGSRLCRCRQVAMKPSVKAWSEQWIVHVATRLSELRTSRPWRTGIQHPKILLNLWMLHFDTLSPHTLPPYFVL